MCNLTYFNKNFRFVFQPNIAFKKVGGGIMYEFNFYPKRFLVGAGQIGKYVTDKNAETVLKTAEKMKVDKTTVKFRKYGKIGIYVK